VLAQEDGKERCIRAVRELPKAFALAVPHEEALRIRDDVAFFQTVQAVLAKRAPGEARPEEELDHAVRQIISRAITPEGVVDIFAAAGLEKPDISILSDEFLAEVRGRPQRILAVELLRKQVEGELPFYDALETNDSAVKVLGDETLRTIAHELVETIRNNVTIDWTLRENVRAHMRVLVKRILRRHGYPPDKQEKATQTVLEQAALFSAEWSAAA
jgi:type I restriction enzyme R subunit